MTEPVFVLVHGAWGGGWNWRYTTDRLLAQGRRVYAPSLTGLGDRAHLMSREVNLSTHIADILGIIESYELENIVLTGHSYGGMVISGVAAQAANKIKTIVYLDAFVPENGQSALGLMAPDRRAMFEAKAVEHGDGWRIPPIPASVWGLEDPEQAAWLDRRSSDQPLAAMVEGVALTGDEAKIGKRVYIRATGYEPSPFTQFSDKLADDPGWEYHAIDGRHFLNVSHPEEVTAILTAAAS
jgi:pimeloyl-ACP methyl ester carboxylesterase